MIRRDATHTRSKSDASCSAAIIRSLAMSSCVYEVTPSQTKAGPIRFAARAHKQNRHQGVRLQSANDKCPRSAVLIWGSLDLSDHFGHFIIRAVNSRRCALLKCRGVQLHTRGWAPDSKVVCLVISTAKQSWCAEPTIRAIQVTETENFSLKLSRGDGTQISLR